MTHFLRFPDEPTGTTALAAAGLLDADGSPISASHSHALDVVGEIPDTDGWHVNYLGVVPDKWLQYAVTPEHPYRVFL
jgi:hypothetical protein